MAWKKFRRGKGKKPDVMLFELNLEKNLFALRSNLQNDLYRHGIYQAFTIHDPKKRRIHKANVRDRIVHQALVNIIEPVFERQFIFDSFSCRLDKGTHAAVRRLQYFLGKASLNNTKTVYVLKCDIQKFFDSVDQEILMELIQRRVVDKRILNLCGEVIASYSVSPNKGLPLGNLTSQLFANIYLHELDRFIKFELKEHHYIRYCDDFVIVGRSRGHLLSLVPLISQFLIGVLKMKIHENKVQVRSWDQGVDFLGYALLPKAIVLRTKTKNRMLKRINSTNASSYFGLCCHCSSYRLRQLMLTQLFDI